MRNVFRDAFDSGGRDGSVSFDDVEVLRAGPKALLIRFEDGKERWIPKSQMEDGGDVLEQGDKGTLVISSWLAAKLEEEGDESPNREEAPVSLADAVCLRETDAALMVRVPGAEPMWVPKSQLAKDNEVQHDGDVGTLVISAWIAKAKGLGPQKDLPGTERREAPAPKPAGARTAQDDMDDEPEWMTRDGYKTPF